MGKVVDSVLPNPVDALGRFVAKISAVKVSTKKQAEAHVLAVGVAELGHLDGFFLPALVRVREISR